MSRCYDDLERHARSILNISKRWCPTTPAIRRARSAPAASSTTSARSCRASHVDVTDHGAGAVSLFAVRGAAEAAVQRAPRHRAGVAGLERRSARAARRPTIAPSAWAPATSRARPPRCSPRPQSTRGRRGVPVHAATRKPTIRAASPAFLARDHGFDEAIVAEPTQCEAVLAHRGISSVLMRFTRPGRACVGANALTPARCTTRCAGAHARWITSRRSRTSASAD